MTPLVNFAHLNHLTEKISLEGESVSIVHVYANHPTYEWADANESGTEGIACVDDAARAAVVYLRHYELTKDESSRKHARSLCAFVMKMQDDDGRFYNFILPDHSINRMGKTSYKSFGWWAARAVWCLSSAYRILREKDHAFAERCRKSVEAALPHVDAMLAPYNRMLIKSGFKMPQWLLFTTGADATSELMLGLIDYARASGDARMKKQIGQIAEGLAMMQDGDWRRPPYGLHRSTETQWHAWGNAQTQALASAACYLDMPELLRTPMLEAGSFYSRLIIHGMIRETDTAHPASKKVFDQIAYDIRPAAVGLVRLYEAKNDTMYLKMAALMASWFFGNNVAGERMYDQATGRCFDGLHGAHKVNRNSGAESTIEALAVMVELSRYPAFRKMLQYKRTDSYTLGPAEIGVFSHPGGSSGVFIMNTEARTVRFLEGSEAERFLRRNPKPPAVIQ